MVEYGENDLILDDYNDWRIYRRVKVMRMMKLWNVKLVFLLKNPITN